MVSPSTLSCSSYLPTICEEKKKRLILNVISGLVHLTLRKRVQVDPPFDLANLANAADELVCHNDSSKCLRSGQSQQGSLFALHASISPFVYLPRG